jgi:sensor histidine kinase regulating citrate/malate metabolism
MLLSIMTKKILKSNIEELTNEYQISVSDNGPWILKKHQETILKFWSNSPIDRFGVKGNGIGPYKKK